MDDYEDLTDPAEDKARRIDLESRLLLAAADAAVTWWRGLKPKGWGVQRHLDNPLVNCTTYREKLLARRASRWFAVTHGYAVSESADHE